MTAPQNNHPHFVIPGAPKCGTTWLYHHLNSHPSVQMSRNKEPSYFAHDFPQLTTYKSYQEYIGDNFARPHSDLLSGEASVFYLYSDVAVNEILNVNPYCRFIVMVRRPSELFPSYYKQLKYTLDEDVDSAYAAWKLTDRRMRGKMIPRQCRNPKLLDYPNICTLHKHLAQIRKQVSPTNRLLISIEELRNNPKNVIKTTESFLNIEHKIEIDPKPINAAKEARIAALSPLLHRFPKHLSSIYRSIRELMGIPPTRMIRSLELWNRRVPAATYGEIALGSLTEIFEQLDEAFIQEIQIWDNENSICST